jgi:hypothetical protein
MASLGDHGLAPLADHQLASLADPALAPLGDHEMASLDRSRIGSNEAITDSWRRSLLTPADTEAGFVYWSPVGAIDEAVLRGVARFAGANSPAG